MITVERTNHAVVTVRCDEIEAGWEGWFFLRSDAHHDSPRCDRDLEKRHLDMVVNRDAMWADFGDLFDAMQGRYDPRRNFDDVRPEDATSDYFDSIVLHAAEFYGPYADRCILLGKGNHETSTLKHASTDLTERLTGLINTSYLKDSDHQIYSGGYGGWVRFMFNYQSTKRTSYILRYMHGAGGRAPVTKGVIQTARQAVYLPDANVVINGHNHQGYIVPLKRVRVSKRGVIYDDIQWHGRIPGYLADYGEGTEGWSVEKGHEPTPFGGLWLQFKCVGMRIEVKLIPEFS